MFCADLIALCCLLYFLVQLCVHLKLVLMVTALCWQGLGKDGLATSEGSAAKGSAAPAPTTTPRAHGSSPGELPYQGSSVSVEGEAGGPLQELVSSMMTGQLGHKMNDSDIHDQLVSHSPTG